MDNLLIPLTELVQSFPQLSGLTSLKNGGQKNVFAATHAVYGSVVLKVYSPIVGEGRIDREIQAQKERLPRVPAIFESFDQTFSTGKFILTIEERVDGRDLATMMSEKGPIDYETAIRLLDDVLEILAALQDRKLVHRDIKPDNILVDANGRFWLIDFGSVRPLDAKTLTRSDTGVPMTYGYAAPEQFDPAMRGLIDSRADLFALGVTVYTLLRGQNPFFRRGMDVVARALSSRDDHATTLTIPQDANGGLAGFIKLLMNKDVGGRPADAKFAIRYFQKFVPHKTV